MLYIEVYFWKF